MVIKTKIRKAVKKNIGILIVLDKLANNEINWWIPNSRNYFLKSLKRKNVLMIAELKDKIIGYQSASVNQENLILEDIYVKKDFRNKNVGRTLIIKTILEGKKYKIKQIQFNYPERLREFYEKLGFRATSLIMKKN